MSTQGPNMPPAPSPITLDSPGVGRLFVHILASTLWLLQRFWMAPLLLCGFLAVLGLLPLAPVTVSEDEPYSLLYPLAALATVTWLLLLSGTLLRHLGWTPPAVLPSLRNFVQAAIAAREPSLMQLFVIYIATLVVLNASPLPLNGPQFDALAAALLFALFVFNTDVGLTALLMSRHPDLSAEVALRRALMAMQRNPALHKVRKLLTCVFLLSLFAGLPGVIASALIACAFAPLQYHLLLTGKPLPTTPASR